jgi:hypothetical protein
MSRWVNDSRTESVNVTGPGFSSTYRSLEPVMQILPEAIDENDWQLVPA